jgi:hypothetical protein
MCVTDIQSPRSCHLDSSTLPDSSTSQALLKLIDERQDLVLEDLDRLNQRIVDIIELYTSNRSTAGADGPSTPSLVEVA